MDTLLRKCTRPSHCCFGLSQRLIELLQSNFPIRPQLVLSIGCGHGLLEHILISRGENVEGVEVSSFRGHQYLDSQKLHLVAGTRDLCDKALEASTWLFMYPKNPELVKRYLESFSNGVVTTLIWLGPINDWEEQIGALYDATTWSTEKWHILNCLTGASGGVLEYEMVAIIEKESMQLSSKST
jgi:hypothetical protein